MSVESDRPDIDVAAQWWADILSAPAVKQDNGAREHLALLALQAALTDPLTTDEADAFRADLVGQLRRYSRPAEFLAIGVDYHPDNLLHDALVTAIGPERAEHFRRWPVKTSMYLNDGTVTVRHGYGAAPRQLWPAVETAHENGDGR